jgi:uncharacterized protein YjbI with pentapeptide repeats
MKLNPPAVAAVTACSSLNWFSAIFLAAFSTIIFASAAARQTGTEGMNPTEKWVVAQTIEGKIADLSKQFPDEEKRKLRAHFLEELLTGTLPGFKPHRNGVWIVGAIIDERIELRNAKITCELGLSHCQFMNYVSFVRASFAGDVSFADSTFKAEADFSGMKVGGDALFSNAVFEGPVDFDGADIAGPFTANGAQFKDKQKGVNFAGMKFRQIVMFGRAVFEGPVNFVWADIAGQFLATNAQFKDKEKDADFSFMKVREIVEFSRAVFEGPVKFVWADIAGQFLATNAQFKDKEKDADFRDMKVGGGAFFIKAVFEGPVNFDGAEIAGQFFVNEAQFKDKKKGVTFYTMKVGPIAFLAKAEFEGPVNFVAADIAGQFLANEAQFKDKDQEVTFAGMKVRQIVVFSKAVFEGPAKFVGADLASGFQANEAQFKDKEKGVDFRGMKVGGSASLSDTVFEGPVDFSYAEFAWLDLPSPFWPKVAAQFQMQGMSYKYIRAGGGNERKSHEALLRLADQSTYTADVYSNLEAFFLRQGYRADADEAFVAGKRRERIESFHSRDWFGWLRSWMLYLLVGYGRRPWQAGIACAAVIALGYVLFSPNKMEQQKPEDARRVYSRFWYSLNLFLPVVDLQAGKVWKPKADQTFLRNYMRVHILLGWILVPLVLAAITGLIK